MMTSWRRRVTQELRLLRRLIRQFSNAMGKSRAGNGRNPEEHSVSEAGLSKPIDDSVAKVDGEVAVGEDLEFQRKWWKFERAVWLVFTLILVLTLAGAFGRGPRAK